MSKAPKQKKVLIFDSGLGGLSIYSAIQKQFPDCQLIYCSDNEAFPYGIKTENELIERVGRVLIRLNQEFAPDLVVIACNTASTVALPVIRSLIKSPIVGVVPAIKPAAAIATSSSIGLLATPATIERRYTQDLIDQFAPSFRWIKVGSSELVLLAESKMYGRAASQQAIEKIVAPFAPYTTQQLDTVVLACTHFPLLKPELMRALPNITNWIDSSEAVANRVGFLLDAQAANELAPKENTDSSDNYIVFTQALKNEVEISALMNELKIKKINTLKI